MVLKERFGSKYIGVLDYGAGNLGSICNALEYLGYVPDLIDNPDGITEAKRLIFPGVGSFDMVMTYLNEKGMVDPLREKILDGMPFLGICLGYQVLFESSEESRKSSIRGLAVFKGKVVRFRERKVPQIGWNFAKVNKRPSLLDGGYYYFVNSYYPQPDSEDIALSTTVYGNTEFVSAIEVNDVIATQFHPEKSGGKGLRFLRRWLRC